VLAGKWADPSGDLVIVLASSTLPDKIIGESSYWRAVYAVRMYEQGRVKTILVSGGAKSGGIPVAVTMRDFMVAAGVPATSVEVETESVSTRENAMRTAARLEGRPGVKVLLTSDYHMWRAWRCFRVAGVDTLPRPIPDAVKRSGAWSERWQVFCDLLEESAKIMYYRANGWI
jgi:uncharacterized SAM-binding protein YcdF (DUF218 family)